MHNINTQFIKTVFINCVLILGQITFVLGSNNFSSSGLRCKYLLRKMTKFCFPLDAMTPAHSLELPQPTPASVVAAPRPSPPSNRKFPLPPSSYHGLHKHHVLTVKSFTKKQVGPQLPTSSCSNNLPWFVSDHFLRKLNSLNCIAPRCKLLYYFTLSNARRFFSSRGECWS